MKNLWKRFWKWFLEEYKFKYECECRKTGLGDYCGVTHSGLCCTRIKGHWGDHVACGTTEHRLLVWSK